MFDNNRFRPGISLLEARDAPAIVSVEVVFTYPNTTPTVAHPSPTFTGAKVQPPTIPLGRLVGWPPIKVGA